MKMKHNPPIPLDAAGVFEVMKALDEIEKYDELYWRAQPDGSIHMYINCSDLFIWACADGEPIGPETLPVLKQAYKDLEATGNCNEVYADMLYCARMREFRPQHACYPKEAPEVWALFDAAGPEREPGLGNPHKHPTKE